MGARITFLSTMSNIGKTLEISNQTLKKEQNGMRIEKETKE